MTAWAKIGSEKIRLRPRFHQDETGDPAATLTVMYGDQSS